MIKRTLEISQQPVHLAVRHGQLVLLGRDDPRSPLATVPCEDVGLLVVDEAQTTLTHAALAALVECGAAVLFCGRNHLPAGMLLPLPAHTEVVWRINDQIAAKKPLLKQLWRQIVQAKVRAQASNLPPGVAARSHLLRLARQVRSGDPSNIEAQAAKTYWSVWLDGVPFHRDPDADGVNALLNYGYAVLRAGVARALVAAGLLPALGIHHANRSNAFCLADDLVEPIRPLVDARVREIVRAAAGDTSKFDLSPANKRAILALLTVEVCCGDQTGPLLVAIHRMVASLVRCFERSAKRLEIPAVPQDERAPDAQATGSDGSCS